MSAAFVRAASGGANGSTTPTVTLAGAPTQNNLLVAAVACSAAVASFTAINGYTMVAGPTLRVAYFYKIAGAAEPAAQAPCTLGTSVDWVAGVCEYSGSAFATLDVSGSNTDATNPQDLSSALNPTDHMNAVMVGVASSTNPAGYGTRSVGGVAGSERVDASQNGTTALTIFDRLNVDTATSTFVDSASASNTPTNGTVGLLIFSVAQMVNPAGIASVKALGAPLAFPLGPITLFPVGIASVAAVGSALVTPGQIGLAVTGIASTAAVGVPTVMVTALVSPVGIARTPTLGTPTITTGAITIHPTGIPSHAQVGAVSLVIFALLPGVGALVATEAAVGALVSVPTSRGALSATESSVGRLSVSIAPLAA